ncbi:Histone-lysine N-methyltransferase PRDM9 [Merluccius polli]|uniref:Histone-lysine N-methyltransferase PRDM9 n=1 Tax=Merluccius polli TaxID=89951 RepID=A0AA47N2P3_MERPO|nr:Histone-lysine N-methyltransferase PRDM9 [Merluccius polli]
MSDRGDVEWIETAEGETPMQKLLDTMSLFQKQSSVIAGPSFILDSPSNMAVPQRALLTLSHGLMIGRSSIPNTGLGVMNQGPAVTPGMHFGPYEGEVTSREDAMRVTPGIPVQAQLQPGARHQLFPCSFQSSFTMFATAP